jgi:hypothetical protein
VRAGTGGIKIGSSGSTLATGIITGSATSLAVAATAVQNVTVTGAAAGDPAFCSATTATAMTSAAYWTVTAYVSAANNVIAVLVKVGAPTNITAVKCVVIK